MFPRNQFLAPAPDIGVLEITFVNMRIYRSVIETAVSDLEMEIIPSKLVVSCAVYIINMANVPRVLTLCCEFFYYIPIIESGIFLHYCGSCL